MDGLMNGSCQTLALMIHILQTLKQESNKSKISAILMEENDFKSVCH